MATWQDGGRVDTWQWECMRWRPCGMQALALDGVCNHHGMPCWQTAHHLTLSSTSQVEGLPHCLVALLIRKRKVSLRMRSTFKLLAIIYSKVDVFTSVIYLNRTHTHTYILWYVYLVRLNVENNSHNIVSLTKHCYGSE